MKCHLLAFAAVAVVAISGFVAAPTAQACQSVLNASSDDELLVNTEHSVAVVTITGVPARAKPPTQGNPPVVQFRVDEVLRGPATKHTRAVWAPHQEFFCCGNSPELQRLRDEWARRPYAGPKVGERFIVMGRDDYTAGRWRIIDRNRVPYTDAQRARVVDSIANGPARRAAKAAADKAAAERAAKAFAAQRLMDAKARLPALVREADSIVVATVTRGIYDFAELGGHHWLKTTDRFPEVLLPRLKVRLADGIVGDGPQLLFLKGPTWFDLDHGSGAQMWQLIDPMLGSLPATPELVESARRELAATR